MFAVDSQFQDRNLFESLGMSLGYLSSAQAFERSKGKECNLELNGLAVSRVKKGCECARSDLAQEV